MRRSRSAMRTCCSAPISIFTASATARARRHTLGAASMHRKPALGPLGRRRHRLELERLEARELLAAYYIAPGGSDAATGSLAAPFATIHHGLHQAGHPP